MNEEIIEEIYNKLVERFSITEVFLPKYGKRKSDITWKQFIKAALELSGEELHTYCGYYTAGNFSTSMKRCHPIIVVDKSGRHWLPFLLSLVNSKRCSVCLKILKFDNFHKATSNKDGLRSHCKECITSENIKYFDLEKEKILKRCRKYRIINKEIVNNKAKIYRQNNKYIFNAKTAKYRASKLKATPNWANLIAIKEIYRTCPEGYHVDHIVPLQGELVCGLHCEFNLQHLPASENLSKGNRFEVD